MRIRNRILSSVLLLVLLLQTICLSGCSSERATSEENYPYTVESVQTLTNPSPLAFTENNNTTTTATGMFGNGFSWTLSTYGTLTVSGYGAMPDFAYNTMPWYDHLESITTLIISEGIESIGKCAFYGFNKITSVTLPETLTTIGEYAFFSCSSLRTIRIPSSVFAIGAYAFRKSGVVIFDFAERNGWNADGEPLNVTVASNVTTNYYKSTLVRNPDAIGDVDFNVNDIRFELTDSGMLVAHYPNGTSSELGKVTGTDGKDGADGEDGITPKLRINEETNMWEVSYNEGKTWKSLGVKATAETREEMLARVQAEVNGRITCASTNPAQGSWTFTEEGYENTDFKYAYRYFKEYGMKWEDTRLTIHVDGTLSEISFKVYVASASQTTQGYTTSANLQLNGSAKFISVVDSNGNSAEITSEGALVLVDQGKTYTVTIDLSSAASAVDLYMWWGGKAEMYFSNFKFTETESIVMAECIYKSQADNGYFAWPSVERIGENKLIAVSSGYRYAHVDPYGKVVGWISEDDGQTWSEPFVIADTVLDDRDAGVTYWNGKIIVSWFTMRNSYYAVNKDYANHCATITPEMEASCLGANYVISEDGGKTWSEPMLIEVFTPHGMIVSPEGKLVYIGYSHYSTETGEFTQMSMITSEDGINWSEPIILANTAKKTSMDLAEPSSAYTLDGTLIVQFRSGKGIYQCESKDGENFTELRLICDNGDSPSGLLCMSDGTLVMTYGYRKSPYNVRARVSYDNGASWSDEIILTSGGVNWDFGYTDSVELEDGRVLTVYYQKELSTDRHPGIMQIIWEFPEKE